jgi:hypothetical protein
VNAGRFMSEGAIAARFDCSPLKIPCDNFKIGTAAAEGRRISLCCCHS